MQANASSNECDDRIADSMRPAMRRGLTGVAVGLAAAIGSLTLVAGGNAAGRHTAPRASTLGSPTSLLNLAFADARAKGSFHQALSQVVAGVQGSLVDDVTLTSGRQAIVSSDGTRAEVEVVGHSAYVMGNQHALRSYFKFSSSQISVIGSNWVSVPATSTAYASIAYDVTASTALAEVAPSGHLTASRPMMLGGQQVIAISGGAPAAFAGGTDGHATIYVTATSDPLPVRATVTVTQSNHSKLSLTGTMGDWGEHVVVTAPTGAQLSGSQIKLLVGQLAGLAIPGRPGYFAVEGMHARPVAFGRPWGDACRPVRLAVASTVPNWIYTQIAAIAGQARKQGIDVTVESRGGRWSHGSLYYRSGQSPSTTAQVNITAIGVTPSTTQSKLPMQLTWNSKLDADKTHEDLTAVSAAFSLKAIDGKPDAVRRSIRQLIAWTQGVSETTEPISGITLRSFTDRFTAGDIAAMLAMSGCAKPTGTTVTGIAA